MTAAAPLLEVRGLNKRFGGLQATSDVSFRVRQGQLVALIGPNGAGKTTVFNLITNLFPPSSGEILLDGASLLGLPASRIAQRGLVRTFQSARVFPGMTVLENVLVGRHRLVRAPLAAQMLFLPGARRAEADALRRAEAMLELVGLHRYRDAHAADLPMGAQKLLDVVRALMAQPRILLLDEPAAGLNDSETAELAALLSAIRGSGITLVLVEHNMPLVMEIADEVMVLEAGRLIMSGVPDAVRSDPRVITAYLGADPSVPGQGRALHDHPAAGAA